MQILNCVLGFLKPDPCGHEFFVDSDVGLDVDTGGLDSKEGSSGIVEGGQVVPAKVLTHPIRSSDPFRIGELVLVLRSVETQNFLLVKLNNGRDSRAGYRSHLGCCGLNSGWDSEF